MGSCIRGLKEITMATPTIESQTKPFNDQNYGYARAL